MQVVDANGNVFGQGLEITGIDGKPKVPVINTDITIGTTAIIGGVSGRLLFDNAGVVGETAGINWSPSTSTLSLFDSPFVSQAGNSSANTSFSITGTASSNYTIYSSRQFIFNTGQSMYFNTDTDGGSALDRAWYFAGARTGMTGGRTYGALTVDSSGFPSFILYNNDNGARILLNSNATSYFNGGNLLIGTTTDAGYKLDVNGSARVVNDITTNSTFIATNSSLSGSTKYFSIVRSTDGNNPYYVTSDRVYMHGVFFQLGGQGSGSIYSGNSIGNATTYITLSGPAYYNPTSGTAGIFAVSGQSFMSSGTATFNTLTVSPIINNTGTYSGIFRGFYYNPTRTSLTGTTHRAIETTSGDVLFNGGNVGIGSAPGTSKLWLDGGIFTKKYYTDTSSQTINFGSGYEIFGTVHASEGYMFYLNPVGWASGWGLRIGNSTNYHQFESSGFRTSSVTTESLSLGGGIVSYYKSSPASGFSFSSGGGWDFVLRGTSDEKFRVKGNGNFLINTSTDAGYKLDVNGASRTLGTHRIWRDNAIAEIKLELYGGQSGWESSIYHNVGTGGSDQRLTFRVSGSTTSADRMSILSSGSVGIGTTTPSSIFDVVVSNGATPGLRFRGYSDASTSYLLSLGTYTYPDIFQIKSVNGLVSLNNTGLYGLTVGTNNIERMRITSGGNMLINTTTDSGYRLDVNGTARVGATSGSGQLYIKGATGFGQYIYLDNGGSDLWTLIGGDIFVIDRGGTRILRANANAQVAINGNVNDASAQMQIESTTRGFLPPRMTNAQMLAIATPSAGLIVYDTTNNKHYGYDGTTWNPFY
jgi:hypothetical protein